MKLSHFIALTMATICCAAAAALAPRAGGDFDLTWHTIDGGGGTSSGGSYVLAGAIGQSDAGQMTGGPFTLRGGFFSGQVSSPSPCPTDTDGSGVVDVDDLVSIILDWNTDGAAHNGDVDGSGLVDVDDLVAVILAWGDCR